MERGKNNNMEEGSSVPQCIVGQDRRAGTEKEEEEEEEEDKKRPLGCGQAQRAAGEEDRLAEEGREEMDRRTGDKIGRRMLVNWWGSLAFLHIFVIYFVGWIY